MITIVMPCPEFLANFRKKLKMLPLNKKKKEEVLAIQYNQVFQNSTRFGSQSVCLWERVSKVFSTLRVRLLYSNKYLVFLFVL
jgi:hypothetical protein